MGKLNDRNDMDNKTIEFWSGVFKKMKTLLKLIEVIKGNHDIDDPDIRWVSDRIEYWDTNDRILTKDEMLEANDLWRLYNGPINVVRK